MRGVNRFIGLNVDFIGLPESMRMICSGCTRPQPRMRTFALKTNFFRITKRCQVHFSQKCCDLQEDAKNGSKV